MSHMHGTVWMVWTGQSVNVLGVNECMRDLDLGVNTSFFFIICV